MEAITSKISMDLLTAPAEMPVIHAVQGECSTRAVQITLFCGGSPWQVPEGTNLAVRYGRIGQGGGYYDTLPDGSCAYSCEGNMVTITLAPQMMAAAGMVTAQVELIHGDQVLVTFSFKVMVAVNPAMGILGPEDYINWQKWLEQELDAYIEKVSQSGQLLGGTMAGPVNMNEHALYGLSTPTADDHAASMGFVNQKVRKAVPSNLLDNSDFTNPVNQRGQSEYSSDYGFDRWRIYSENTSMKKADGHITVTGAGIWQNVPNAGGKIYTLAAKKADGTIYIVSGTFENGVAAPGGELVFNSAAVQYSSVMIGAGDWLWAALYEGEYTEETLPEYQPKGYGTELIECMRYFQSIQVLAGEQVYTSRRQFITLPIPMRVIPTYTSGIYSGEDAVIQVQDNQTIDVTGGDTYSHVRILLSADL